MKYKIEDEVYISNIDYIYPNYSEMANIFKLKNWSKLHLFKKYEKCKIIAISEVRTKYIDKNFNDVIFAVENKSGNQILINSNGIATAT